MPDMVRAQEDTFRRSRRIRVGLTAAVAVALVIAAAAFTVSLLVNYDLTHQALRDAQAATRRANVAAVAAESAADHANAAHAAADAALAQARVTRADLCAFLERATVHAPEEERRDAAGLAKAYHCPPAYRR